MAEMATKARAFQDFLDAKEIKAFVSETIENDPEQTTVFRSHVEVDGQQLPLSAREVFAPGGELPLLVLLDRSIFSMIRVQISPKCKTEENELAVLKLANDLNLKYKPFKLYFDGEGSLILDICMITPDEKAEEIGDMVYGMFNVMITFLNENYRTMMKTIW